MTDVVNLPIKGGFPSTCVYAIVSFMILALIFVFVMGIANFAMHQAVLSSGHALLNDMPQFGEILGFRFTLIVEFVVLLAAMLFVANGWPQIAWGYAIYFGLNCLSSWLILTDRI